MSPSVVRLISVLSEGPLTSLDSSIPGQAAMRLDAGHKDGQLATLAAAPSCDGHAQRLLGFLLYSDVLLLRGHTLGKVLTNGLKLVFISKKPPLIKCRSLILIVIQIKV